MRPAPPVRRILLTGATGRIGRLLLPALDSLGVPLRVLVHRTPLAEGASPRVEAVHGDVLRPATIRAAVEDCDVIVHAAARTGYGSLARQRQRDVNVGGTETLLRAARAAGARIFVLIGYTGTVQERDDVSEPVNEETPPEARFEAEAVRMMYEAEALVLEANGPGSLRTLVVSPGVLVGPSVSTLLGDLIDLYREEELPYRVLESAWLATSDAADVGRCVASAIDRGRGGRRYFATGECLTMGDLYGRLAEVTGVRPPRRRLPDLLVEEMGLLTPVLPPRSFLRRLVYPRDLVAHMLRLAPVENRITRAELGFAPTPFGETLAARLGAPAASARRRAGLGG